MTPRHLIRRSLRYYWRTHLGVILGAALSTLILTGALFVGDSVKATLRRQAHDRTGKIRLAMLAGDRFFRSDLATAVNGAPVLMVRGSVARADGTARINEAQILGITPAFWTLGPTVAPTSVPTLVGTSGPTTLSAAPMDSGAVLNARAAEQLGAKPGDTLILRIEKPSAFSRDAPLSGGESESVALRVPVSRVIDARNFGNFSLQANQVPPFSIFLPLEFLQARLGQKDAANLLLSRRTDSLRGAVEEHWQIADAGLELRPLPNGQGTELRTARVFLEPVVAKAAPEGLPSLTYLVNEIAPTGQGGTPYSMATAVDTQAAGLTSQPLEPGEAAITQWEADDLAIGVGGKITVKYFVMGERRQLVERSVELTVKAVLPMNHPGLDSAWMPDFPGLSDKQNCRDWEPGFALDTARIRDRDEAYWKTYRGTPKIFLNLEEGQRLWGNRWGKLTSIRYPADFPAGNAATKIQQEVTPERIGFTFVSLLQQALEATEAPVDFGQLFLYFSFFLLVASGALTGLLFVFSLEQRNDEVGLLRALGWPVWGIRRLLLLEGLALAIFGSLLGLLGAFGYTRLALWALETVWRRAAGGTEFLFEVEPLTAAIGVASGIVVALLAMWLASRRQFSQSAASLLAAEGTLESAGVRCGRSWSAILATVFGGLALGLLFFPAARTPEGFFGIGSLLLLAGLCGVLALLRKQALAEQGALLTIPQLGRRNASRRRGRSLAIVAVLACGVFMVVAVDAFRQRTGESDTQRASGTGGFALVGESALPIYEDLNAANVRQLFGLDAARMNGVHVIPFRVREGDEASCLNLNRPLQPRLLGLKATDLDSLQAFQFREPGGCWGLLDLDTIESVPGIVDATTLEYSLKMKIGDMIPYVNERGEKFTVRIAGTVAGSLLQGNVLIAESHFIDHFPSSGGYRYFLIDVPPGQTEAVRAELSRALIDRGLELTPAVRRLAEYQAVENTYLSIFQALGGLGLLLGSLGMAIVVGRNVLERRREFGLLEAVGFQRWELRSMVLAEHRWLIGCGVGLGVVCALLGVWPSLRDRSAAAGFPWLEMGVLLVALSLGAFFWAWLATRLALRREQIGALRNE